MQQSSTVAAAAPTESLEQVIARLARGASVEINFQDVKHLDESRALLPAGSRVFISHLPKQTWEETESASRAVRDAGFDPVPHIPVRLLPDEATLDRVLGAFVGNAGVREVLLISGDYPEAVGPYSTVAAVLRTGLLSRHGLKRVSIAGHPEGHPKAALADIRSAESERTELAAAAGIEASLVTQFFFESAPFLDWVRDLRARGIKARVVGGLAGPASLAALFRFAARCGAGPSVRALGQRPASLLKLVGDRGPEDVLRGLAASLVAGRSDFAGIHMFCFGGYLRACAWLNAVAAGRFKLDNKGGFTVQT